MSRRIARTKAKKALLEEEAPEEQISKKLSRRLKKLSLTQLMVSDKCLPAMETLEIFRQWTSKHQNLDSLQNAVQTVKTDLFERNYIEAFNSKKKREAYAIRWSSSRCLAYSTFLSSQPVIYELLTELDCVQILNIGGGAGAELIAFASIFSRILELQDLSDDTSRRWDVSTVDISNWRSIVSDIDAYVQDRWVSPNNYKKLHSFNIDFQLGDILNMELDQEEEEEEEEDEDEEKENEENDAYEAGNKHPQEQQAEETEEAEEAEEDQEINEEDELNELDALSDDEYLSESEEEEELAPSKPPGIQLAQMDLITSCFTTNELFAEDKVAAIKFLRNMSKYCQPGTLFLVLESAGSFSNVTIGSKQFPIYFLIDTVLCGKPDSRGNTDGDWEVVDQNDSIWYRVPSDVEYDLKLENMRFFYRLYRKT